MNRLVPVLTAISLGILGGGPGALAAEPHVHGAGTLQLVLESGNLNAELRLPAMDVVGFEHAPREAKHKEAVKKAAAMLKDSRQVLALPDDAQCTAAPGTVESELLEDAHAAGHKHDKHDKHDKHETGHDHADGETHADFEVAYRFGCRRPEALKQIKVLVFQQLPKLERLDVEMVTSTGQRSQRLVPGQDTIALP